MEEHLERSESKRMADDAMHINFSKRRKLFYELEDENCAAVEITKNEVSPAVTSGGYEYYAGRRLRSPDLENVDIKLPEGSGTEIFSSVGDLSRENTSPSEFCEGSQQATLTAYSSSTSEKKPSPPPPSPPVSSHWIIRTSAAKMPPPVELEKFFAAAETYEQKRFTEKYNYDVVKDLPLKGRYEWVRLRP